MGGATDVTHADGTAAHREGRDDNGTEFVPSITVYFEAANDSPLIPEREWYIKLGDHTLLPQPPIDAERIRVVRSDPMTKFGAGELPDWRIMT